MIKDPIDMGMGYVRILRSGLREGTELVISKHALPSFIESCPDVVEVVPTPYRGAHKESTVMALAYGCPIAMVEGDTETRFIRNGETIDLSKLEEASRR